MTHVTVIGLAPVPPTPRPPRPVRRLVAIGDSTAVGLGDPLPDGRWRGFPVLLRDALGGPERVDLTVLARTGARMAHTRQVQAPAAAALAPDVVVLCAGLNDTLRSDFDPAAVGRDCAEAVSVLHRAGAHVLLVRFHDHSRVLRLPGPLGRALHRRIAELNAALDSAVLDSAVLDSALDGAVLDGAVPPGVGVLDLDRVPGAYQTASWSVDRLHPSERGHRLLARGFGDLLAGAGWDVVDPVDELCAGGRRVTPVGHAAWLVGQGVPWLARRGCDLGPVIARALVDGMVPTVRRRIVYTRVTRELAHACGARP